MPISGLILALPSQSHRFSGTKAGSMAPVYPFAQLAVGAGGALVSVGFGTFNMEKCPQIMIPFLLHKVSSLTIEIDSHDNRIMEITTFRQ